MRLPCAVRDRKADWIQEPAGRFSAMAKRARDQRAVHPETVR
jgi:hypothetical protein